MISECVNVRYNKLVGKYEIYNLKNIVCLTINNADSFGIGDFLESEDLNWLVSNWISDGDKDTGLPKRTLTIK